MRQSNNGFLGIKNRGRKKEKFIQMLLYKKDPGVRKPLT